MSTGKTMDVVRQRNMTIGKGNTELAQNNVKNAIRDLSDVELACVAGGTQPRIDPYK